MQGTQTTMQVFSFKNNEFSFINYIIEQERKPGSV